MTNGQDTATDDASQDTGQDTAASDPNLVNTPKNEGYGRNVQTSLRKTSPMKSVTVQQLTIAEQSMLAMQQFGILVIGSTKLMETCLHSKLYFLIELFLSFREIWFSNQFC